MGWPYSRPYWSSPSMSPASIIQAAGYYGYGQPILEYHQQRQWPFLSDRMLAESYQQPVQPYYQQAPRQYYQPPVQPHYQLAVSQYSMPQYYQQPVQQYYQSPVPQPWSRAYGFSMPNGYGSSMAWFGYW